MATWGVVTHKRSPYDPKFTNRYYISAISSGEALDRAEELATIEATIFGTSVEFYNVHVWLPNQTPNLFENRPLYFVGSYLGTFALAEQICAEFLFGGGGSSYPSRKEFRVQIDSSYILGDSWKSDYLDALQDAAEAFNGLGYLINRNGTALTGPAINNFYTFRQTSKRWYDRTP